MISQERIKSIIKKLPDSPGVYLFKYGSEILYIGKATSLRDRVKSYFRADIIDTRSPLIHKMLSEFESIDFIKTDSVIEALVLEAHLIKKFQPKANTLEKDDKSFNFVVITKEDFPRVLIMRGRELLNNSPQMIHGKKKKAEALKIKYSFGPFVSGTQLKEAMKIVRKMFPFRDDKCLPNQGKPCFNRQIGLCPGVCTGEISMEDYDKQIKNISLFFEGNKNKLVKSLEDEMHKYAQGKKFELAEQRKRTIFTLKHIQDVSLIKEDVVNGSTNHAFRIESYDIAHMSGKNVVGVMTVIENGEIQKNEYRKFKIRENPGVDDTRALGEVLTRRIAHIEWRFPNLIVVDGGKAQKSTMEKILKQNNVQISVVSVLKDERHKPKEILGDRKWLKYESEILLANSESHRYGIAFHKQLRGKLPR